MVKSRLTWFDYVRRSVEALVIEVDKMEGSSMVRVRGDQK